jgi:hypothetical protein
MPSLWGTLPACPAIPARWKRAPQGVGLLLVLVAGCTSGPSAPALDDEPIYKAAREGFRFSRPEGWTQWARGDVPAGKLEGERLLVEYRSQSSEEMATLEVSVASVAPTDSLSDFVTRNCKTGEDWRLRGPVENFTINGEAAVRLVWVMAADTGERVREIVAFRRDDRVYFFKGFYAASDTRSRREFRSAVDTVVW